MTFTAARASASVSKERREATFLSRHRASIQIGRSNGVSLPAPWPRMRRAASVRSPKPEFPGSSPSCPVEGKTCKHMVAAADHCSIAEAGGHQSGTNFASKLRVEALEDKAPRPKASVVPRGGIATYGARSCPYPARRCHIPNLEFPLLGDPRKPLEKSRVETSQLAGFCARYRPNSAQSTGAHSPYARSLPRASIGPSILLEVGSPGLEDRGPANDRRASVLRAPLDTPFGRGHKFLEKKPPKPCNLQDSVRVIDGMSAKYGCAQPPFPPVHRRRSTHEDSNAENDGQDRALGVSHRAGGEWACGRCDYRKWQQWPPEYDPVGQVSGWTQQGRHQRRA